MTRQRSYLKHTFASHFASSGEVDLHTLQKMMTHKKDDKVKKAREIVRQARANFLEEAKRKIEKWPNEAQRQNRLRIAGDPRIESFLDALAASGGKMNLSQYVGAVRFAADCVEPWEAWRIDGSISKFKLCWRDDLRSLTIAR